MNSKKFEGFIICCIIVMSAVFVYGLLYTVIGVANNDYFCLNFDQVTTISYYNDTTVSNDNGCIIYDKNKPTNRNHYLKIKHKNTKCMDIVYENISPILSHSNHSDTDNYIYSSGNINKNDGIRYNVIIDATSKEFVFLFTDSNYNKTLYTGSIYDISNWGRQ